MKISTSPITNTIYAGNTKPTKQGEIWTKKEDVTNDAIRAVFDWLKSECKDGKNRYYEVKFENVRGRMLFDIGEKESEEE